RFEMTMAKADVNSKPVLAAEDVHIVTVYGRIYCLQVDRVAMLLHSYRFYRDAVIQQGSLPVYSSKIAVSVVDNVLLIHQVDAKVIILYDIFADSRTPVSAPLPLLIRGLPRAISSSQSSNKDAESSEATLLTDTASNLYNDDWRFLVPDLVCDVATGYLWKVYLDLE
ncbi:regulator of MON1-CCZ1 complex, partial [Tanacetum coccineum]